MEHAKVGGVVRPDPKSDSTINRQSRENTSSDWRPWTIRTPFLVFFIFLCVALSVSIEVLLRVSERSGALSFADPDAELSPRASFLLSYLPTLITVCLGLLWSLPDHDYRRLEPYIQLSKPGGASAEDSILLDYTYANILLIPYLALKKRHWSIFYSAAVLNMILLAIVPLTSGIFEQDNVNRIIEAEVSRATLRSAVGQTNTFTSGFSFLAYNHEWLNGTLPAFVEREYAILPFITGTGTYGKNETWTGETTIYEADLDCRKAEIMATSKWLNISNGKDCEFNMNFDTDLLSTFQRFPDVAFEFHTGWGMWFMGHLKSKADRKETWAEHPDHYKLSSKFANCSSNSYLGLWGSSGRQDNTYIPENLTAVFCEPSYWSQGAQAVVQMPAGVILNITRRGPKTPFDAFNRTRYEELISTGLTPPLPEDLNNIQQLQNFGYFPSQLPDPTYQLSQRFGIGGQTDVALLNTRSLSGFTLARQPNETLAGLLDPVKLGNAYNAAYKLLFAFAVGSEMTTNDSPSPSTVKRAFSTKGFVINKRWSRFSQGGFGILILLTICLIISAWGRRCAVDGEPNSIAGSLMVIAQSHGPRRAHNHDVQDRYKQPKGGSLQYELRCLLDAGPYIQVTEKGPAGKITIVDPADVNLQHMVPPGKSEPGWYLRRRIGALYCLLLASILAFATFLYIYGKRHDGLPTIAKPNSIPYKILFTYLPTIIGMCIEPFWRTLASYACMVGPYERLHKGHSPSSKSLTIDYDNMPPHFQLFRAIKSGNFVLSALTIALLVANLLAVALAGYFLPISTNKLASTSTSRTDGFRIETAPDIWESTGFWGELHNDEIFYTLSGNLSGYGQIPEWTTEEFYILPFNTSTKTGEDTASQQGRSIGLGSDISCQFLDEDAVQFVKYDDYTNPNTVLINHPCWPDPGADYTGSLKDFLSPHYNSASLIGYMSPATDFLLPSRVCPGTMVVGWMERSSNPEATGLEDQYLNKLDHVFLVCNSSLQAVEVSVTVDETSHVLRYDKISNKPLRDFNSTNMTSYFHFILASQQNQEFSLPVWPSYNDSSEEALGYPEFPGSMGPGVVGRDTLYSFTLNRFYHPQKLYWINALMLKLEPKLRRHPPGVSYIPEKDLVIEAFQKVYTLLFAMYLQLNAADIILEPSTTQDVGSRTVAQDRVGVSPIMFAITAGILGFFTLVVLLFYSKVPGRHLGQLPTTLASTYGLLYGSTVLGDISNIHGEDTAERAAKLDGLGDTYGYISGHGEPGKAGVYKDTPAEQVPLAREEHDELSIWEPRQPGHS